MTMRRFRHRLRTDDATDHLDPRHLPDRLKSRLADVKGMVPVPFLAGDVRQGTRRVPNRTRERVGAIGSDSPEQAVSEIATHDMSTVRTVACMSTIAFSL